MAYRILTGNKWARDQIIAAIERWSPFADASEATVGMILNRMLETNTNITNYESILPFIEQVRPARRTSHENARTLAWRNSRFKRDQGRDDRVDTELLRGGFLDLDSQQSIAGVIEYLGDTEGWEKSTKGIETDDTREREQLIREISADGQLYSYTFRGRLPGEPERDHTWPVAELNDPSIPIQKIRDIAGAVADYRHKQKYGNGFERKPQQMSELDRGELVRTENNGYAFVPGTESKALPQGGSRMDRTSTTNEGARQLFVNPSTGAYYSRQELRALPTDRIRILMRNDIDFFNALLAGKV